MRWGILESLQTTNSVLYKNGSKYLKSLQEHLRFLVQWTGFYMISASVMKGLNSLTLLMNSDWTGVNQCA